MYGPVNPCLKPAFWDDLKYIGESFIGPWCIAGDFNAILEQKDKLDSMSFFSRSQCRFRELVDDMRLLDLGYIGYLFTWNNRSIGTDNIQERLDEVLINLIWRVIYPQATVRHLPAYKSDHKPILLHTFPFYPSRLKPFQFKEMWIRILQLVWLSPQRGVRVPNYRIWPN